MPQSLSFLDDDTNKECIQPQREEHIHVAVKIAMLVLIAQKTGDREAQTGYLGRLAEYLSRQYQQTDGLSCLEAAMVAARQAVDSAEDLQQPHKAVALNVLSNVFNCCYLRSKQPHDLLQSIVAAERAATSLVDQQDLASTVERYPMWPALVNNLAKGLYELYKITDETNVLDVAIRMMRVALLWTPNDRLPRWDLSTNLFRFLNSRYQKTRLISDLQEAIGACKQAGTSMPAQHPQRPERLNELGNLLNHRFEYTHNLSDLNEAIQTVHQALELVSENHPSYGTYLGSLSVQHHSRFNATQEMQDLEASISWAEKAIRFLPKGHEDELNVVQILAHQLQSRYEVTAQVADLNEAIKRARQVVDATDKQHPEFADRLDSLCTMLYFQNEKTGDVGDIEEIVIRSRQALEDVPNNHPDRNIYLVHLGNYLERYFDHTGEVRVLEEAIELTRHALQCTPNTHFHREAAYGSLGNKLERLYGETGKINYLNEAIEMTRTASESAPQGSFNRAARLNDLGNQLEIRYERTGQMGDLDQAIAKAQLAIQLTPASHPRLGGWLNNLALKLNQRYTRTRHASDLNAALARARQAVDSTPDDHSDKAIYLNGLGIQLGAQYRRTGRLEYLKEAIGVERQAVNHPPRDHASRVGFSHNLGLSLELLFQEDRNQESLEEAIKLVAMAAISAPAGHPVRASRLISLGGLLETKYELTKDPQDWEQMSTAVLEAWRCLNATPFDHIRAGAQALNILATDLKMNEGIEVGIAILSYLPVVHTRTLSLSDQQFVVNLFSGVASNLATLLLLADRLPEALQYLELGRTVIINQLLDDRSDDISSLQRDHPDLADQYRNLVDDINMISSRISNGITIQPLSERRAEAADELKACLRSIRSKPLYSRFLLGYTAAEMQHYAAQGYIVVVNLTKHGAHAIIIFKEGIRKINLDKLSSVEAEQRLAKQRIAQRPTKSFSEQRDNNNIFLEYLAWLWDVCVKHILHEIFTTTKQSINNKCPRVWWVGAGLAASMPFHAAGKHRNGSAENAFSQIVSSYTPSIRALAYACGRAKRMGHRLLSDQSMLITTMPTTPNGPRNRKMDKLPKATEEKDNIAALSRHYMNTTVLEHPSANQVSDALKASFIAHFACHGVSDRSEPSRSALILQKRPANSSVDEQDRLTVYDVSRLALEHAHIAYLSVCSTAENKVEGLADEVIHVASGFQVAGFPHVIASLWHTGDSECADVATRFYSLLFKGGNMEITGDIAEALQDAVLTVRESLMRQPLKWAQFVHYGP